MKINKIIIILILTFQINITNYATIMPDENDDAADDLIMAIVKNSADAAVWLAQEGVKLLIPAAILGGLYWSIDNTCHHNAHDPSNYLLCEMFANSGNLFVDQACALLSQCLGD